MTDYKELYLTMFRASEKAIELLVDCLLYTSDAADE